MLMLFDKVSIRNVYFFFKWFFSPNVFSSRYQARSTVGKIPHNGHTDIQRQTYEIKNDIEDRRGWLVTMSTTAVKKRSHEDVVWSIRCHFACKDQDHGTRTRTWYLMYRIEPSSNKVTGECVPWCWCRCRWLLVLCQVQVQAQANNQLSRRDAIT